MKRLRLALYLLIALTTLYLLLAAIGLDERIFEVFSTHAQALKAWVDDHRLPSALALVVIYVALMSLSVPVGIVLAVVAGYLFGVLLGTLLIAVASLMSAWLVFRLARGLLYRRIQRHFKKPIRRLSEEFKENGLYYLMALRLSYMLPFFLVNITLGSLPIRTGTFLITTAAGLLPGTILYVWLGQSLAEVEHLRDLIDLKLAALFILLALLALLPVAYKKLRTHFSAS